MTTPGALRIKLAASPGERRAVFATRHRVFVEEEGYFAPTPTRTLVDLYDAVGTSANLCALVDGRVVGAVRTTLDSEAGLPADDAYDFRRLEPPSARLGSCGRMCVLRAFRDDSRVIRGLLRMAMHWAVAHDCTHLCGTVNPPALDLVQRIGFRPVDDVFATFDGRMSVPVWLDVDHLAPDYAVYVRRQPRGREASCFDRWIDDNGDPALMDPPMSLLRG